MDSTARSPGVGHRLIQVACTGSTRATGVCCSMNSETMTDQALASSRRHGRSRACSSYHCRTGSWSAFIVADARRQPLIGDAAAGVAVWQPRLGAQAG
ncbi:hypothetical protein NOCA2170026 [metagenome]|uniref:Uncharacterized protein n=1 Tax=metagenome TaxID=256318 RepID=A0A2P2BXI8_9ZZZZ